jgi:hypothetical protein
MVIEQPPGLRHTAPEAALLAVVLLALAAVVGLASSDRLPALSAGELQVFRLQQDTVRSVSPGGLACEGDLVQLVYDGRGAEHGVIWSVDARGVVSLHHPSGPRQSSALSRGPTPLGFSWELDDAPGDERFFFVTAAEPLDPARVLRSARAEPVFALRKGTAAPGCTLLR